MDWLNIPNIISFIMALIAVITLIVQNRAAAKQVRFQNFIEYTKRYQDIILNFPESINEPTFMLDNLSEEVKTKTIRYMRAYFDLCYEEFVLHEKKFIDDKFWEIWKGGM
jgi:superfamily I DNA and/or RNA helicase